MLSILHMYGNERCLTFADQSCIQHYPTISNHSLLPSGQIIFLAEKGRELTTHHVSRRPGLCLMASCDSRIATWIHGNVMKPSPDPTLLARHWYIIDERVYTHQAHGLRPYFYRIHQFYLENPLDVSISASGGHSLPNTSIKPENRAIMPLKNFTKDPERQEA